MVPTEDLSIKLVLSLRLEKKQKFRKRLKNQTKKHTN